MGYHRTPGKKDAKQVGQVWQVWQRRAANPTALL
jgi:hypothetical protein